MKISNGKGIDGRVKMMEPSTTGREIKVIIQGFHRKALPPLNMHLVSYHIPINTECPDLFCKLQNVYQ